MKPTIQTWIVASGVVAVLLFFFAAPLAAILYGGGAGAISGAIVLAPFLLVQYLIFWIFRSRFPKMTLGKPDDDADA